MSKEVTVSAITYQMHKESRARALLFFSVFAWKVCGGFYDELERICTDAIELTPGGPNVLINIPAGQWHTVRALESVSVLLEMKDGKHKPSMNLY